ncbi:MAG: fibronectin type III domain-containing protein [Candidatus Altimarinota bacterium]
MNVFSRIFIAVAFTLTISHWSISIAFADENDDFSFEIANSLNVDATRSMTALPDVTITVKKSYEGPLAIKIPSTLKTIFSQDVKSVLLGGSAGGKMEIVTASDLSEDQKSLNIRLKETLKAQETLIISGLQMKIFQEDNTAQPIQLEYMLDGATFLLNSASTVRLDADGLRRRFNAPEAVRNIQLTPVNATGLDIRWSPLPDLDGIGYELTVKPTLGGTAALERTFIEKNKLSYTVDNLNPNLEYTIVISSLNSAGLKTDVSVVYQPSQPEIDSRTTDYKNLSVNPIEFALIYESLVPVESRQFPFDGSQSLTNEQFYQLLQQSNLYSAVSRRTQLYIQRLEKIRANPQELTNTDLIRLLALISLRERVQYQEFVPRPDLKGKSFLERRYALELYKLQRRGVITDPEKMSDSTEKVSMEALYTRLSHLLDRLQPVEENL